jgi:hypothetical protein
LDDNDAGIMNNNEEDEDTSDTPDGRKKQCFKKVQNYKKITK